MRQSLYRHIQQWIAQKSGATAIEYGLIAAGISVAIMASVFLFGDALNDLFFSQLTGMLTP